MTLDDVPSLVAAAAVDLYQRLPSAGKPRLEYGEFTVLASVVGINSESDASERCATVFSLATGTKCCGAGVHDKATRAGMIIKDSHAEVLARRGFRRYLSKVLLGLMSPECDDAFRKECILEKCPREVTNGGSQYRLKPTWRVFIYISDNPCGDASIYSRVCADSSKGIIDDKPTKGPISTTVLFTGAKKVGVAGPATPRGQDACRSSLGITIGDTRKLHGHDDETRDDHVDDGAHSIGIKRKLLQIQAEPREQTLGSLRTKSGRSDIPAPQRCFSHSCSDKLCRWVLLGMQGSLLAPWLAPVSLTGVFVDADPAAVQGAQETALRRAVEGRCTDFRSRINGCCGCSGAKTCFMCMPASEWRLSVHAGPTFQYGKSIMESQLAAGSAKTEALVLNSSETAEEKPKSKKLQPSGMSLNWVRDVVICAAHAEACRTQHRCCDFIEVPNDAIPSSSAKSSKRRRLIWARGGTVEVTLAQTGALLGCSKKNIGTVDSCSRLSRYHAVEFCRLMCSGGGNVDGISATQTYQQYKKASSAYAECRSVFLQVAPFDEWLVGEEATG